MKRSGTLVSKGAEEARQQLPAILAAAAAAGQTTMITRHGREIAAVVPAAAIKSVMPVLLLG